VYVSSYLSANIINHCPTDLDATATALPTIAAEFQSSQDIGAYGSAFLLPQAVLQPFFGKLYTVWSIKPVYLGSLALFEGQFSNLDI